MQELMHGGEKTDPAIADSLARIIQSRWLNKLNEERLKSASENYLRLGNCKKLISPRVNPEIWKQLDHIATRTRQTPQAVNPTVHRDQGGIYLCKNNRCIVESSWGEQIP